MFCLFLFITSFFYAKNLTDKIDIIDFIMNKNRSSLVVEALAGIDFKDSVNFLDLKDKNYSKKDSNNKSLNFVNKGVKNEVVFDDTKPIIYIFNTHQSEEYANGGYAISPTVVTASYMLKDELNGFNISSLVEEKDVIKEVRKRGYDYSGTYTVSFEYLKSRKKDYPSLEYYFDVHRDSITGDASRVSIDGKKYATMMFLVGSRHDNYKKNVNNLNVMKKYLDNNYKGLVRDTFLQSKWTYNQWYSEKMFLVEIGGPDNTLEEVSNTIKALAEAIKYYVEGENEK